jgi:hypothetical protein
MRGIAVLDLTLKWVSERCFLRMKSQRSYSPMAGFGISDVRHLVSVTGMFCRGIFWSL